MESFREAVTVRRTEGARVITFFVYITAIAAIFTVCAVIADLWGAKVERDARHQARAEARAQRRKETEVSDLSEPYSSLQ